MKNKKTKKIVGNGINYFISTALTISGALKLIGFKPYKEMIMELNPNYFENIYLLGIIAIVIPISLLLMVVAIELYPTLLISTIDPKFNIHIYNAASSNKSLGIMLLFVVIGAPLIIGYTFFVYKTFWGKVELGETSY